MSDTDWSTGQHAGLTVVYDEHGTAVATFTTEEAAERVVMAVNGALRDAEIERLRAAAARQQEEYDDLHTAMQQVIDAQRERYEVAELELALLRKEASR